MLKHLTILAASVAIAFPAISVADAKVRPHKIECRYLFDFLNASRECAYQGERSGNRARPCGAPVDRLPVILINGPGTPGHEGPDKPDKDPPSKPEKPTPSKPEKPTPSKPDKPTPSKPDRPSRPDRSPC